MKFKFLQKPLVLLMLLTAWGSFSAFGQNMVSGNVVSNENEPLIGVTVVVQNTTNGTSTDIDGHFEIRASSTDAALSRVSLILYPSPPRSSAWP